MKQGFADPPLHQHFPGHFEPASLPVAAFTRLAAKSVDLDQILRDTYVKLNSTESPSSPRPLVVTSPTNRGDISISSSHMMPSVDGTPTKSRRFSDSSDASSQGTVEKRQVGGEPKRHPEDEPLIWARELVTACRGLFVGQLDRGTEREIDTDSVINGDGFFARREVGGNTWIALASQNAPTLVLILVSQGSVDKATTISLSLESLGATCEAIEFFDDDELAVILNAEGDRYLATVSYQEYEDGMAALSPGQNRGTILERLTKYQVTQSVSAACITKCWC